jgi:hypothetical protein
MQRLKGHAHSVEDLLPERREFIVVDVQYPLERWVVEPRVHSFGRPALDALTHSGSFSISTYKRFLRRSLEKGLKCDNASKT